MYLTVTLDDTTSHAEVVTNDDINVSIKRGGKAICLITGSPQEMIAFALTILNVASLPILNPEE